MSVVQLRSSDGEEFEVLAVGELLADSSRFSIEAVAEERLSELHDSSLELELVSEEHRSLSPCA